MNQKEINRKTIEYIRKCQAQLEDFSLCVEGYSLVLDKTNKILNNKEKINLSIENKNFIIDKATEINNKIIDWKSNIDQNPKKHLCVFFIKWLGFEYIYSLHNLYNRSFTYKGFKIKGSSLSHFANKYIKEIMRIQKEMELARDFLMKTNKKLIISAVQSTIGSRQYLFDDLLSIANIQFIKCMDETYSLDKGTEFSTYAYTCMKHKCKEALIQANDFISIPHYQMGERLSCSKQQNEQDINIVSNLIINSEIYSLEKIRSSEKERDREDLFLSDGNVFSETQNQIIFKNLIKNISQDLINKNPKNKIKIKAIEYKGYFDFENKQGDLTLEQVAEKLYQNRYTDTILTRERIRVIIKEGLKLFKSYIRRDHELMKTFNIIN